MYVTYNTVIILLSYIWRGWWQWWKLEEILSIALTERWRRIWPPIFLATKDIRERISYVQSRNERSCEVCKWV